MSLYQTNGKNYIAYLSRMIKKKEKKKENVNNTDLGISPNIWAPFENPSLLPSN